MRNSLQRKQNNRIMCTAMLKQPATLQILQYPFIPETPYLRIHFQDAKRVNNCLMSQDKITDTDEYSELTFRSLYNTLLFS